MGVKALFALDNIWDGIGAVLYNNPEMRWMIGKVTIYPDYNETARELIYNYLERFHQGEEGLIAPYHPLPVKPLENDPFAGDDPQENYHILQHAVREQGVVIPPMFSAYLNLTNELQTFGTAIVLVSHNIGVIRAMADKVLVLKDGETVEYGDTRQVLGNPQADYTRALLSAVPSLRRA